MTYNGESPVNSSEYTEDQFSTSTEETSAEQASDMRVIDLHADATHGQNKCPKCGSSDIAFSQAKGKLRCLFCRHEFDPVAASGIEEDLDNLTGISMGKGAQDIEAGAEDMITLKCEGCAAEVVINTVDSAQARCHWCRSYLSLNNAVPNGAVPDVVLPFHYTKAQSQALVCEFIKSRWFFANTRFKREFTADNIFGVYLPYMIVDLNAHISLHGEGEELIRRYTVTTGSGDNKRTKTYYDANAYDVYRDFDITIDDLTVESSADKLDNRDYSHTKNVINAILPFDTKNALKWDANYLKGYHSEKRDVNRDHLQPLVYRQAYDIACEQARSTIAKFDRGVRWDNHELEVKGEQWISASLPVWLYSYQRGVGGKIFFTAVNARTGETMGSVPINYWLLTLVSLIIFFITLIAAIFVDADEAYVLLGIAPAYAFYIYTRYTNQNERHYHESETDAEMKNLDAHDVFLERRNRLTSSKIKDMTHMPKNS